MAGVTYTKQQREVAKKDNSLSLAAIAVDGVSIYGPMSKDEVDLIRKCFIELCKLKKKASQS